MVVIPIVAIAQDWRWEVDQNFLAPSVSGQFAALQGAYLAGGMHDLNEDGEPEYVLAFQTSERVNLYLAESEGDFPDIRWSLNEGFFGELDLGRNFHPTAVTFYDLDGDGAVEIIFDSAVVLQNRADYDHPNWSLAQNLYPVQLVRRSTSNFCDWDQDGNPDLILGYNDGYYRFERNDQGEWASLGFITCVANLTGISVYTSDVNGDGVIDIFGPYDLPESGITTLAVVNEGTPENPSWGEPLDLSSWGYSSPFPFDLDKDGSPDILDEFRYQLHVPDSTEITWERPVYWRLGAIPLAAFDIDNRGEVELFYSISSGPFDTQDWRLGQIKAGRNGWEDAKFFGRDHEEWGRGPVVVDGISFVDLLRRGTPQLVLSVACDPEPPRLELYEDVDTTAGWDWQLVDGYFSRIIRASQTLQIPSFGDFDGDGDLDVAIIEGPDFEIGRISIYEQRRLDQQVNWVRRIDWQTGLPDSMRVRSIGTADFDRDGKCELVTIGAWAANLPLRMYRNIGRANHVEWTWDSEAFTESGPDSGYHFIVADINEDDKPDILLGRTLKQPQVWINQTAVSVSLDPLPINAFGVNVIPNPANAYADIVFDLPLVSDVSMIIYDSTGRLRLQNSLGKRPAGICRSTLDLSDWSSGSYLVEVKSGATIHRGRMEVIK